MMHATTLEGAASAVPDYFYSTLAALEDFDAFCSYANEQMHLITSRAIALSLERFSDEYMPDYDLSVSELAQSIL